MSVIETQEQEQLRSAVAKLAQKYGYRDYVLPKARRGEPLTELWDEAGKLGFLGVNLPEEYGGGGAGIYELALVQEELAAAGAGLLLMVVSPAICGTIIAKFGTDEQKQEWLPRLADGSAKMVFGITEPDAGSNSHQITTTARCDGDSWILNGRKVFISGVDQADAVLIVARTSDTAAGRESDTAAGRESDTAAGRESDTAAGRESDTAAGRTSDTAAGRTSDTAAGRTSDTAAGRESDTAAGRETDTDGGNLRPALLIVPTDAENFVAQPMEMDIVEPDHQFMLFFDDVRLPADALVGQERSDPTAPQDAALAQLFAGLNPERILGAAMAVGMGRYALDRAVEYANQRSVWKTTIGAHQGIAHPLAQVKIEIELAKTMMQKAAVLYDSGDDVGAAEAANMAKYAAAEASINALDQAIQTHGGAGLTSEYGLASMLAAARIARVAPVSREMILNFVAQHSLGLPKSY